MVLFFKTYAKKFVAIPAHLMIALLISANAIRKIYTLMLIIDGHLGLLITGPQCITSILYIVKDFFKLFKMTLIQCDRLYVMKTTYCMEKINQDTILHFYRILENSLLESDISKMSEGDIDAWSQSFKKVVAERKETGGKGVFVPFLMWRLGEISPVEASKCLDERKNDECRVSYDHNNVEYVFWVMALMFMSWSITNLKRKTQNGHCQNIEHPHRDTNARYCQEGTKFHQELYNECVKTFQDLLTPSNSLKEEKH